MRRGGVEGNHRTEFGKFNSSFPRFKSKIKPNFKKTLPCFTLAEVLITLVVIGVIAAITVPIIINSYQKQVTIEKLKKTYSALSQTTARAIADNGPIESWEIENISNDEFAKKYLLPYLNVNKVCKYEKKDKDCFYTGYYLNGSSDSLFDKNYTTFYLADGVLIKEYVSVASNRRYADLWIDINGSSKPNKRGKDIFSLRYEIFGIAANMGKFLPHDYNTVTRQNALNNTSYGCNKNSAGNYCFNVILKDGWQIKDDYPW